MIVAGGSSNDTAFMSTRYGAHHEEQESCRLNLLVSGATGAFENCSKVVVQLQDYSGSNTGFNG
jgi:hypothetical protein